MKNLLSRKWFRRLCQTSLAFVSLLILLVVVVNWHGARMRRAVISEMRAQGRPTSIAQLIRPMPRDQDNFAMIPILRQSREEQWRLDLWNLNPVGKPENVNEARDKLAAMSPADSNLKKSFPRNDDSNFRLWKERLKLEGDPAACLAAYDLRSAGVLADLRQGLSRPETVSPALQRLAEATDPSRLTIGHIFPLGALSTAMNFRAELALAAGDHDAARESLLISMRLLELIGAEETLICALYQNSLLKGLQPTLGKSLENGAWNEEQLSALKARFSHWDVLGRYRRAMDLEIINVFPVYDAIKTDRSTLGMFGWHQPNFFVSAWRWLPSGWFDRSAAILARNELNLRNGLGEGEDLAQWLKACRESAVRESPEPSFWGDPVGEWNFGKFCEGACRGAVVARQAMLACDLEIHRLRHGSYPADLSQLSGDTKTDPLTGELFRYRTESTGFILYSIGSDLKDDGATPKKPQGKDSDWVW